MTLTEFLEGLPLWSKILAIVFLAVAAHLLVRGIRSLSERFLTLNLGLGDSREATILKRYPKFAGLTTILVGAATFTIYFLAVGFILHELTDFSLTAYLASASVIGLAIGFGSQGLVQDVVIGLTLIFSDALNVDDVVEISGQVGTVEQIGLRFTILVNIHKQRIYIPNRNIAIISRFRGGAIRAYVDIQLPPELDEKTVTGQIQAIAEGMYQQHRPIILNLPEIFGVREIDPGNWRFLRVKFRLWPGQNALVETAFRQRVLTAMKKEGQDYADWMITITYRVD